MLAGQGEHLSQTLLFVCEAADGVKTPSTSDEQRCEVDSGCSHPAALQKEEVKMEGGDGLAAPLDLLTLR